MQQPNNIKNKNRQYTNANENQPNTTRNKTQEEVTTHNTSNITIRKKTNNKPQNTKTNQQYETVNEPSPVTDKEFPKLTENNNTKRKENLNKSHTEKNSISASQIQKIPETPLELMPKEQPEIEFLSSSLVTDKSKNQDTTPQSIDVSTPNKETNIDERLELHQIKIVPQNNNNKKR